MKEGWLLVGKLDLLTDICEYAYRFGVLVPD